MGKKAIEAPMARRCVPVPRGMTEPIWRGRAGLGCQRNKGRPSPFVLRGLPPVSRCSWAPAADSELMRCPVLKRG